MRTKKICKFLLLRLVFQKKERNSSQTMHIKKKTSLRHEVDSPIIFKVIKIELIMKFVSYFADIQETWWTQGTESSILWCYVGTHHRGQPSTTTQTLTVSWKCWTATRKRNCSNGRRGARMTGKWSQRGKSCTRRIK